MQPNDIHKTGFITMDNHYKWLVMPYGYKNSPSTFQRIIHIILQKHNLNSFAHNYLDDILIHSKTFDEHLYYIEKVFKAFLYENIKLKLSKCNFADSKVKFFGHIISHNKISPLNDNVIAIKDFPTPNSIKSLQQFLGKVNYYHKYIPSAAKLLNPLYNLLKKNVKFIWDEKCENAFQTVKNFLISEPILTIFNPNETCYLFTDSSKVGLGAVLKQKQSDGKLRPIAYFSKKLLKYQQNYSATELECLAIVESIEYWHHYLYNKRFFVTTDHNALRWLNSIKKPNSRLFKWSLKLSQYEFEVHYQQGKFNVEADCLSRNPISYISDNKTHLKIVNLIQKQELIDAQQNELQNQLPKKCFMENDLVVKIKNNLHKVYVPENLRKILIKKFHVQFGHIGTKKMMHLISSCYFWSNMTNDIKNFVDKCFICQTCKVRREKLYGELSQIGSPEKPFDIIAIDTVGGFKGYNSSK